MSNQFISETHILAEKEMEAWWNMMHCIFNFLTDTTKYALKPNFVHINPILEENESTIDVNLSDFPFIVKLFRETNDPIETFTNREIQCPGEECFRQVEVNSKIDLKFSEAFENCCRSMHKLEQSYIDEYEKKKDEIFNLFSEESRIIEKNNQLKQISVLENMSKEPSNNSSVDVYGSIFSYTICDSEETIESINFLDQETPTEEISIILTENNNHYSTSNLHVAPKKECLEPYNQIVCQKCEPKIQIQPKKVHTDNVALIGTKTSRIPQRLNKTYKSQKNMDQHSEKTTCPQIHCAANPTQDLDKTYKANTSKSIETAQETRNCYNTQGMNCEQYEQQNNFATRRNHYSTKCYTAKSSKHTGITQNPESQKANDILKTDPVISCKDCKYLEKTISQNKRKKRNINRGISEIDSQINVRSDEKSNVSTKKSNLAKRFASVESIVKKTILANNMNTHEKDGDRKVNKSITHPESSKQRSQITDKAVFMSNQRAISRP